MELDVARWSANHTVITWTMRVVVMGRVVMNRASVAHLTQLGTVASVVDSTTSADGALALHDRLQTASIWTALVVGAAMVGQVVPDVVQAAMLEVLEELSYLRRIQLTPLAIKLDPK